MNDQALSWTRPGKVTPPQSLEERKNVRRRAILQAAEVLVREGLSTDFSMQQLAAKAGISTYTTYNLIGNKSTVLYILLNHCIDRIDMSGVANVGDISPERYVIASGIAAARVFTDDGDFYRPLMRFLFGVPDRQHRPVFMKRAQSYWMGVSENLRLESRGSGAISTFDLAVDFLTHFTGALDAWVHGETNDRQFAARIRHGLALRLLIVAEDGEWAWLKDQLVQARSEMGALYYAKGNE